MFSRLTGARGRLGGFSLLSSGNFLTAVLAYLRQAEIARVFGTNWKTDAFAVALVFPTLAQQVISHAFGSSFLPIYSDVLHNKGRQAADRLASRILCWMAVAGLATIALLFVAAGRLTSFAGPGLSRETLGLSTVMLRTMLPMLVLVSATGILSGLMSCQKRFGIVGAIGVVNIAASFAAVILGHARYGIMILPLSGLAGAAASFVTALTAALRYGFVFTPLIDPRENDFGRLVRLSAPVLLGALLGFTGPIVDKILASFLSESSVTAMDYAARVRDMALALLFLPVSALSDVGLSEKAARKDMGAFGVELSSLLNWTSFMMLPAAALLSVFATPLVSVLFMRGSFDADSASLVGRTLGYYAPWLAQFGFGAVISRGFYALKNSRTPVLIGIWGTAANILLDVILVMPMGTGGIALASTLSSTAKTVLLTWTFLRMRTGISLRPVLGEHVRLVAATAAAVCTALVLMRLLPVQLDMDFLARLGRLSVWIAASLGAYVLAAGLLRSSTLSALSTRIMKRA